jgi:hypothetical protein
LIHVEKFPGLLETLYNLEKRMETIYVEMELLEANLVLSKPKVIMKALFNIDPSLSWEVNLKVALKKYERRIGIINLAGRQLDLTVSGTKLNKSIQSEMICFVTDTASIILKFFELESITATFILPEVAPSEVSATVK